MAEPEQTAKPSENRPLRVILYILMILYVGITAWLIYQNETIGTTQLGYSSLHADQLKELQSGMVDLIKSVELIRQQEKIASAIVDSRLEVLEKRSKQIGEVLQSTANADQQRVLSLGNSLTELEKQATTINQSVETLKNNQQQVLAAINNQLVQVQKGLADTANALANQREQVTTALRADVTQIRTELAQAIKASSAQSRQQVLAALADETLIRARAVTKVDETNLGEVWQLWRQAELWAGTLPSDPALAPRAKALSEQTTELSKGLVAAVSAAVAKYDRMAMSAASAEAAQAAFAKAGEFLQFFPSGTNPATEQIKHNLHLAHEAVRQRVESQ